MNPLLLPALLPALALAAEATKAPLHPKLNLAPPAISAKEDDTVTVKESYVRVEGISYKRLEIGNDVFYLTLQQPKEKSRQENSSHELDRCRKMPILDPADRASLKAEVTITKRTKAYVYGLYRNCDDTETSLNDFKAGVKYQLTPKSDLRLEYNKGPTAGPQGKTIESKLNWDF